MTMSHGSPFWVLMQMLKQNIQLYKKKKCSAKLISGLRIMAANRVINSALSSPNSVYSVMSIVNSVHHIKLLKEQIFFNKYHRAIKAVR